MATEPMPHIQPSPISAPSDEQFPPSAAQASHTPVLLAEALEALQLRRDGVYIDGTFGGGGHSRRMLDDPAGIGCLIAIDADANAHRRAEALQAQPGISDRLRFVHANFRDLKRIARDHHLDCVDGILLDLGLSSFQLDEGERGFSFRHDAALDMRFDQTSGIPASDLLNSASQEELAHLIWRYGEDPQSRRIAAALVREREKTPLMTTGQVAEIVEASVGGRRGRGIHPATRTFQALRIAVNDELRALGEALPAAIGLLAPGGRLVVIAFHSLEDRIVKRAIEAESAVCICPPEQPVCTCDHVPRVRRVGKPVRPADDEIDANPRSRSAIMRVAERLDETGRPAVERSRA
ncbi:MAG TPA: 16S rRNA (cytosine(1402)-N(4))-methyltransferase RsmH [Thermomicrobiales bacterium]|nr:16S rRNA (cytosine(1402)-N(4))-methyltransferase RsmH [Thermomicrobiales bacterium]